MHTLSSKRTTVRKLTAPEVRNIRCEALVEVPLRTIAKRHLRSPAEILAIITGVKYREVPPNRVELQLRRRARRNVRSVKR